MLSLLISLVYNLYKLFTLVEIIAQFLKFKSIQKINMIEVKTQDKTAAVTKKLINAQKTGFI
jgi:hypothetical protein